MKKHHSPWHYAVGLLGLCASAHATVHSNDVFLETQVDSLVDAMNEGDLDLSFRVRIEDISKNNSPSANANTLQTRLTFTTPKYYDLSGKIAFNHVSSFADKRFNPGESLAPSKSDIPEIPDPRGTTLIKAYLQYTGLDDFLFRLGRQEIRLDNERFIGSNDFRQTPQTFDALTIQNTTYPSLDIFYAYVSQVNSIYAGSEVNNSDRTVNGHLFNVTWDALPYGNATGYLYMMHDRHNETNSNNTYGVRFFGDTDMAGIALHYVIEGARQSDAGNNTVRYHSNYHHAGLWGSMSGITSGLSYESLQGNAISNKQFRTPLASYHGFNGWTETFNPIPSDGLIDIAYTISGEFYSLDTLFEYHSFQGNHSTDSLGNEWDLSFSRALDEYFNVGFKWAFFDASQSTYENTQKIWLYATGHF